MIRSILMGLDGTESDIAVEELGIRWARRFDAQLTGIAIVDDPGIQFTDDGLVARSFREPEVASLAVEACGPCQTALRRFSARCADAGVPARAINTGGSPHEQILLEAERHDMILVGKRSHFDYGWEGRPGQTLGLVLKDSSRPVVAVPESPSNLMPEKPAIGPVVIAYDGSLQAARTLFTFQASGLGHTRSVHVISIATTSEEATRHLERAVEFLKVHDVEVVGHPLATARPTADVILEQVHDLDADLLVMGAYGQPSFREFVLGSVTRTILEKSTVPLFCYH